MKSPYLQGFRLCGWLLAAALAVGCDSGDTAWKEASWGFEPVPSTLGRPLTALLRDPAVPHRIFAACGLPTEDVDGHSVVLTSDDGGAQWTKAGRGLPESSEITTLGFAPLGFLDGKMPALVATLENHLPYYAFIEALAWHSLEGMILETLPSGETVEIAWKDVTLQTQVALDADGDLPAAMVLGTREIGPLVSEDGGCTWHVRRQGMTHLDVQELAVTADGALLAATWYGGVYRSPDRGKTWTSLDPALRSRAISSMAVAADGTLWLGLQNGGLLARAPDAKSFEPQGRGMLDEVGVLTLAVDDTRVGVGTGNHGIAIGRSGEPFRLLKSGLDKVAVSALLLEPRSTSASSHVLVGTWSGLFRSRPQPSLGAALLVMGSFVFSLALLGSLFWRRTTRAQAKHLGRRLIVIPPEEIPRFLTFQIPQFLHLPAGAAILEGAGDYCARHSAGAGHALFVGAIRAQGPVLRCLQAEEVDGTELADALARRLVAVEELEREIRQRPDLFEEFAGVLDSIQHLRARDRLYVDILRAENPAHLKALREPLQTTRRLLDLEVRIDAVARHGALRENADEESDAAQTDASFFADLAAILDHLDALDQISVVEERGHDLGQALARILSLQDDIEKRRSHRTGVGDLLAAAVLDVLRQVVTDALDGLRQRALIDAVLRTKRLPAERESGVVLEVSNVGQGHAQQVRIELLPGDGFTCAEPVRELRHLLRRQSARLDFLLRPVESEGRYRLMFRLTWDDSERRGRQREYSTMVRVESSTPRVFRPLRPNPYVVGRPLIADDPFYGRAELFSAIAAQLEGARQDNIIILIGQRRMGKTSVLRRLGTVLREKLGDIYVPVLIDLQGILGDGETAFFREIATILVEQLRRHDIHFKPLAPDAFREDPGHTFRRQFLPRVLESLGNRRLLLVFDELEVLEERIRDGSLTPRILPYLRSLMQHESGISFIFAGTHRLDELTRSYWSVFFNLAIYLEINHLDPEESNRLFTEPTRGAFEIDPRALERAYRLTGGHPHFSQLLARELVSRRNQKRLAYVTPEDLRVVAERVAEKGRLHIAYLWEESSAEERCFLAALTETLDLEGAASLEAVHRCLAEHGHGDLRPASLLRALERRRILRKDTGGISFHVDLLRRWLRQGNPWELCDHV